MISPSLSAPPDAEPRTIRRQIASAFVAAIAIAIVVGVTTLLVVSARLRTAEIDLDRATTASEAAATLRESLLEQETGFRGYELTGNSSFLGPYGSGRASQHTAESAFLDATTNDPTLAARLKAVTSAAEVWQRDWVEPIMQQVAAGQLEAVHGLVATSRGEQLFDEVRTSLNALDAATQPVLEAARRERRQAEDLAAAAGVGAIVLVVAILGGLGAYLHLRVAWPLAQVARAARRLRTGATATFPRAGSDEIGTISASLQRLHAEVEKRSESAALEAARATALNELSETLSLAADERGLLEACALTLRRVLDVDGGQILLLTTGSDLLLRRVAWGAETAPAAAAFASSACPAIRTARVLVTDNGRPEAGLGCPVRADGLHAHVCVPVMATGRKIGVIHLLRDDPAASFARAEVQLATQIGTETALVLANRRLVTELETMAMTDPLTGVKNARFFDAYVEKELRAAERDGRPLGVVMFDVDHFKEFNDAYGHPAGDEALRTLTRTAESTIRASDTLARYGGEEFIVAVRNADLDETMQIAEKIRRAIEAGAVRLSDGRRVPLSASFGVASTSHHGHDRRILVLRADQALYRAKQRGRNRVEIPFLTTTLIADGVVTGPS